VDHERAERHLRQLAESGLREAALYRDPDDLADVLAVLDRVADVGKVLTAVGAVDGELADGIVAELRQSVIARSLAPLPWLEPDPGWPGGPVARPAARAPGPLRVTSVGRLAQFRGDGIRCDLYLMSGVVLPGTTSVAVTVYSPGPKPTSRESRFDQIRFIDDHLTATDDRGVLYRVHFSGHGSSRREEWVGYLDFDPQPPNGVKWLDLVADGAITVARIDFTAAANQAEIPAEPHPAPAAERLLTAVAEHLLATGEPAHMPFIRGLTNLGAVVTALEVAGALPAASALPGFMAGLCQRLGWDDHGIAATAPHLPGPWLDVLGSDRAPDQAAAWPSAAAVAVSLPEVDGARFAVAGALARRDESLLHVMASGLPYGGRDFSAREELGAGFSWWVRAGGGRWHVAVVDDYEVDSSGEARFTLSIRPPLSPETDETELVVTGPSARIRVRLSLVWRALEW
jgi:hypothetical protein